MWMWIPPWSEPSDQTGARTAFHLREEYRFCSGLCSQLWCVTLGEPLQSEPLTLWGEGLELELG